MAEEKFEQALIKKLTASGWTYRDDLSNQTEEILWVHWRELLNQHNYARLNDVPISDTEFLRLRDTINALQTPYDTQSILSSAGNVSTISLMRDSGETIDLEIFYLNDVAGGNSVYEVVKQITFDHLTNSLADNRRIDLLLLINGLPVGHIEEKDELLQNQWSAFEQLKKYAGDGMYTGLMTFVQVQFIMSQHSAHYFARPDMVSHYNKDFLFNWRTVDNVDITDAFQFVDEVLNPIVFHRLITVNIIPDNVNHENMVMRSYQIQATRAILQRLKDMSERGLIDTAGGYIWHTTGSGKTVTSFKVSQLIAMRPYIDDVLFVVDRVDLINQTYHNFVDYADAQFKSRIHVRKGYELRKRLNLKQSASEITLITLQGLHKAVKSGLFSNKRMVIIMDEAHRSASGDAVTDIKTALPNTTWFGFTGTPNFYSDKDSDILTSTTLSTHDVFGDRLHQYTIRDAIGDKNVLGFDITYMEPNIVKSQTIDSDDDNDNMIDSQTVYHSEIYKTQVVSDIGENWYKHATARRLNQEDVPNYFSAMLAVSGKADVITYYKLFKTMFPELNVAMTYSKDDTNSEQAVFYGDELKKAIVEYIDKYQTIDFMAQRDSARSYIDDVTKRLAHKNPYQQIDASNRLDLVIVADQLLTGFDSKYVNMLYVDKPLQESGLIQAISRANRVLDMTIKPYAKVRFYRNAERMQDEVARALTIYTQGGQDVLTDGQPEDVDLVDSGILARDMVDIINTTNAGLVYLRSIAGTDFEYQIMSEADQIAFVNKAQRVIADIQLILAQGYDFGNTVTHHETGEEAVLDLSSKSDYGKLKARTNDTLKAIPTESMGDVDVVLSVSLSEYDTEQVNYDTLTVLLQQYQEKREPQVKKSILDWAAGHSDLHTRLVTSVLSDIDQKIMDEPITYGLVQTRLNALKQNVVAAKLAKFAGQYGISVDEMIELYDTYIPGVLLVDNIAFKQLLIDIKKAHDWKMTKNRIFKDAIVPFLDQI